MQKMSHSLLLWTARLLKAQSLPRLIQIDWPQGDAAEDSSIDRGLQGDVILVNENSGCELFESAATKSSSEDEDSSDDSEKDTIESLSDSDQSSSSINSSTPGHSTWASPEAYFSGVSFSGFTSQTTGSSTDSSSHSSSEN